MVYLIKFKAITYYGDKEMQKVIWQLKQTCLKKQLMPRLKLFLNYLFIFCKIDK